jgi:hypothetical protein
MPRAHANHDDDPHNDGSTHAPQVRCMVHPNITQADAIGGPIGQRRRLLKRWLPSGHDVSAIAAWQARWHNAPLTSDAYTALPHPPTGTLPPVIEGAAGGSRLASATLVRLITGHAFIGSYRRFHPDKPTHCPHCGVNPQTVSHVIKHCPHYAAARATFLTATKACFTPKEEPFDPGNSLPAYRPLISLPKRDHLPFYPPP